MAKRGMKLGITIRRAQNSIHINHTFYCLKKESLRLQENVYRHHPKPAESSPYIQYIFKIHFTLSLHSQPSYISQDFSFRI